MIKKIIKYGTAVASGVVIGAVAASPNHDKDMDKDKIWQGETIEVEYSTKQAERVNNSITQAIQSDEDFNFLFMEDDLRSVRAKIAHALSDANDAGEDTISVELTDRERLRVMEGTMPVITSNTDE